MDLSDNSVSDIKQAGIQLDIASRLSRIEDVSWPIEILPVRTKIREARELIDEVEKEF